MLNSVASVKPRIDTLLNVGWVVAILALLLFVLDSFIGVPNSDSSVFMYVGQGILKGELPYLDRFDHKGPLIYFLNAIGLALFSMPGVWLIEGIFLLATVSLAIMVVKENFGVTAALFSVAVFLGYFGVFAHSGNFTEQYALLFQFLALYLFIRIEEDSMNGAKYTLILVSIGALAAAAFLLRPNLVGVWIAIGLYWIFVHRGDSAPRILWAVIGAFLVLLPTFGIFAIFGGLRAFWDAAFIYNIVYSDAPAIDRLRAVRHIGVLLAFTLLPIIAGWCAGLYHLVPGGGIRNERFVPCLKLILIWLPIEVIMVSISVREYQHYYLALLPAVTMVIAFFAFLMTRAVSLPASLISVILLIAVSCYFLADKLNETLPIIGKYTSLERIVQGKYFHVAELIREETDPDDPILVWGTDSSLYLISERDAPTRFFYTYSLIMLTREDPALLSEFISEIRDERPALIIDERHRTMPPLDSAERLYWRTHVHGTPWEYYTPDYSPDVFQPFFDFFEEEYELMDDIKGFAIYQKIE